MEVRGHLHVLVTLTPVSIRYEAKWPTEQVMDAVVRVNVKLYLCLTKQYAMTTCCGVEVYLHAFFDLGTRRR
jgi:hypothetical protein